MNKSIVGWVVAGLAVLCLASRAMADAEADYKALFGEEDQRVVTSKDTKAAADFAFKLLKTAKVNNDKKDLQILLCEKAYDFGMKDPSGYQTAIDAMKLHIKAPIHQ